MSVSVGSKKASKPGSEVTRFLDARKTGGRLLAPTERWLAAQVDTERRQDVLHPSELCRADFCPRAVGFRISGVRPVLEPTYFGLQNVFDEGHEYHRKWQYRWARMDDPVLWGWWKCMVCGHRWYGRSPERCGRPECVTGHLPSSIDRRELISYQEVRLSDPTRRIYGQADGELRFSDGDNVLAEVKSLAKGTIRIEAPRLFSAHNHKVTVDGRERTVFDIDALWRDLHAPLGGHERQGQIYLALRRSAPQMPPIEGMNFIYENKVNQQTKEFFVRFDAEEAASLLRQADDITWYLAQGRIPKCPKSGCAKCEPYEQEAERNGGSVTPIPAGPGRARVHDSRRAAADDGAGDGAAAAPPRAGTRVRRRRPDRAE